MTGMTIISQDAQARREAARDRGRFGEQTHTEPELAIGGRRAQLDDLWEVRQSAAAAVAETDVALIAARMHKTIGGVRFLVHDGTLIPNRYLRASEDEPVSRDPEFADSLDLLTAYAQNKNQAVELSPVHDGTDSWDWIPDASARAMSEPDAEAANTAAREEFREASYDLGVASEQHLTAHMPDGISAVDVVYLSDGAAVFGYAYDHSGEPVVANFGSEEWTDFRLIASRAPDTVHRIAEARQSDILGTHFHLERR